MAHNKTAVALGLFDGVHNGHRAVISKAAAMAEKGFISAVFTFRCETLAVKQGRSIQYIYSDSFKEKLLRGLGAVQVCCEDFSAVKDMSGDEFVREILLKKLNAGHAVCGRDFRFGKNASCGVSELSELCCKYGIVLDTAEDVVCGGENVSSRRIRELLTEGNIPAAENLLGGRYTISGVITDGNHIGRTIDFPTINQNFGRFQLVPRFGVYSSEVDIDGKTYKAVTNIGVKPTIAGERAPLAETHILGFSGDLYGRELETRITGFIRPEQKFDSLDDLKRQISADIISAKSQT